MLLDVQKCCLLFKHNFVKLKFKKNYSPTDCAHSDLSDIFWVNYEIISIIGKLLYAFIKETQIMPICICHEIIIKFKFG